MPDGTSAQDRLLRLLHVLPSAAREGGARLTDLARELDTTAERISEDLEEATTRVYYHPGGWPDDMLILLERDRVRVEHAVGFERPIRLTAHETLCLSLALRGAAAEARLPEEDARVALLRRAEQQLAQGAGADREVGPVEVGDPRDPEGVRRTILAASAERRPCLIHYVKPGATDAEIRRVEPWAIVAAEGHWYALGHCERSGGRRAFRLDRVLAVDWAEGAFEVPEDFDPEAWIEGRRLFHGDVDGRVRVRYSPRIARWVRERAERDGSGWVEEPDGSVLVTHPLADDGWALAHVFQYGADAEIVEPESLRARCRGVLEALGA